MTATAGLFAEPPRSVVATAVLSPDGVYRYELSRLWDRKRGRVTFVMLNPSTADADSDDPTIRRCVGFAKAWGYGSIVVRNLYGLRSTDPDVLWSHPDPVGPDNPAHLAACALEELVVCAWGAHGHRESYGYRIAGRLTALGCELRHLGLTKGRQPKHPLYLPGSTRPVVWAETRP